MLRQKRLGQAIDFTSTSLSFISLIVMAVALGMIARYVRKMQLLQPGKLKLNLPLFFLLPNDGESKIRYSLHCTNVHVRHLLFIDANVVAFARRDRLQISSLSSSTLSSASSSSS